MTHPVDAHVGKRIRHRRWMVGMTQQQLADRLGINLQQVQRYESGVNRVSASRLWDIAAALTFPVSVFFEGFKPIPGSAREPLADLLLDREAVELVRSYFALPENQRRRLLDLARALAHLN
jgi:transcriptional regulator with XRE-family HTH domain